MKNELAYNPETLDAIMELGILYEKAEAVATCLMAQCFENNLVGNSKWLGLTKDTLAYIFPHMQQLAFVISDYFYEIGEAIKALKKGTVVRPEQPPQ